MAGLSLKHIYKVYQSKEKKSKKKNGETKKRTGDFLAVRDFNMEIEDGEFIVFVGPSGCGKSTTLRMIAGLEDISAGSLYIGDRLVNDVDPKDRDIAMVFQNYALYPHMTAGENIAFGLKMRKVPVEKKDENGNPVLAIDKKKIKELQKKIKAADLQLQTADETTKELIAEKKAEFEKSLEYFTNTPVQKYEFKHIPKEDIDAKVKWAAEVLGVTELLDIRPKAMSGGQRQRIALGRAIVREPKVMLLDEPLSNLDAKLRTSMRSEIVRLHNELKTTFIYVTHDQIEAMTMGTRIVVMKLGVVQQIDTPTNLFDYPENKFVAGFIGTPQMNFFDVTVKKNGKKLEVKFVNGETQNFNLENMRSIRQDYLDGNEHELTLGIRGENITIGNNGLTTNLTIKEILGNTTQMFVKITPDSADSIVCVNDRNDYAPGDIVKILLDEKKIHLFDKDTELAVMSREYGNGVSVKAKAAEK